MLLRTLSLVAALVVLGRTGAQTGSSSPVKEHLVLKEGSGFVWSLSFHRDSRTLAAALEDKTVRVYDVAANKELAVLKEHADAVRAVAFSPDGKLLASGSKDGTVKLWSWDGQAKLVATLEGHKNWVLSLAFSPDGKLLASGGKDGAVKVWNVAERKLRHSLDLDVIPWIKPDAPRRASALAFSPNGKQLGVVASDLCALYDPAAGKRIAQLTLPGRPVTPAYFADDSFGGDAKLEQAHSSGAFTANGKGFASVYLGGTDRAPVKLWDVATGRPRDLLQSLQFSFVLDPGKPFAATDTRGANRVYTFAFSPNGKLIGTGGFEVPYTGKEKTKADTEKAEERTQHYLVKLWDATRGNTLARLKGHKGVLRASAFSPDSTLFATGGEDGMIRVWAVGKALQEKGN